MITKTLNIDLDSLAITSHGFSYKSNDIDYSLFQNKSSAVWYDVVVGFKIKKSCSILHKVCDIIYNTANDVIEIKLYELKDNYVSTRTVTTIPIQNYTEESFFMESTLQDFGEFSFEHYMKITDIVKRCKKLMEDVSIEKSNEQ